MLGGMRSLGEKDAGEGAGRVRLTHEIFTECVLSSYGPQDVYSLHRQKLFQTIFYLGRIGWDC